MLRETKPLVLCQQQKLVSFCRHCDQIPLWDSSFPTYLGDSKFRAKIHSYERNYAPEDLMSNSLPPEGQRLRSSLVQFWMSEAMS